MIFKNPIFNNIRIFFAANLVATSLVTIAELVIALFIQYFLKLIGVTSSTQTLVLDKYFPDISISFFCTLFFILSFIKFVLDLAMHYPISIARERTKHFVREKISPMLFDSNPIRVSDINHYNGVVIANTSTYVSTYIFACSYFFLSICLLVFLFIFSWKQAFICLFFGVIAISIAYYFSKKSKSFSKNIPIQNTKISAMYQKVVRNLLFIKIAQIEDQEHEKIKDANKSILNHNSRASFFVSLNAAVVPFLGILVIIIIFLTSPYTFKDNELLIVPFLYLFMRFAQFLSTSLQHYSNLSLLKHHFDEAVNICKSNMISKKIKISSNRREPIQTPPLIEIKNLTFQISKKILFSHFNLTIKPGEFLGIVGESGKGKSTLLSLILGLQKQEKGNIYINGTLNNVFFEKYNMKIGYVGPDPLLFEGTIHENLSYGLQNKKEYQEIDYITALKTVGLNEYTSDKGLRTMVTEDLTTFSAGEKQRLCIARSLIQKPSLLILDEFTSNLDERNEHSILKAINQLKPRPTTIIVSHRKKALFYTDRTITL